MNRCIPSATAMAVGMVLLMLAAAGRADDRWDDVPCRVLDPLDQCPTWTGRAESLLLWRGAPQSAPLFSTVDPTSGLPASSALDAADFASGMAAGPRFSLFRHTGDTGQIEATYFRAQSFEASAATPPTDGGYVTTPGAIFCCSPESRLDTVTGGLSSAIQSFELNRRLPTDGRWQWLAGFRWVSWNESLGLDAVTDLPGISQRYASDTTNDLYGMQVGADSILCGRGGPFWIEGIGKAGLFYNRATQFTSYTPVGDPFQVPVSGGSSTSRAAFVGELGVTGVYQINDWLALRAGYVVFWLGGIAQAPNQLADQCLICADEPVRLATNTGGSTFIQGLTLGLEGRW